MKTPKTIEELLSIEPTKCGPQHPEDYPDEPAILLARLGQRFLRAQKLAELQAPQVILDNEKQNIERARTAITLRKKSVIKFIRNRWDCSKQTDEWLEVNLPYIACRFCVESYLK